MYAQVCDTWAMTNTATTTVRPGPEFSFADKLRKVRREVAHMTQEEMADALNVGLKAYSSWEAGKNPPRNLVEVSNRLELVTGVDRKWFVGWAASQPSDYKGQVSHTAATSKPRPLRSRPSNRRGNAGPKSSR